MVTMKRGQVSEINANGGKIKNGDTFVVFSSAMCRPGDFESFEVDHFVLYLSNAGISAGHEMAVVVIPENAAEEPATIEAEIVWELGKFSNWTAGGTKGVLLADQQPRNVTFKRDTVEGSSPQPLDRVEFVRDSNVSTRATRVRKA